MYYIIYIICIILYCKMCFALNEFNKLYASTNYFDSLGLLTAFLVRAYSTIIQVLTSWYAEGYVYPWTNRCGGSTGLNWTCKYFWLAIFFFSGGKMLMTVSTTVLVFESLQNWGFCCISSWTAQYGLCNVTSMNLAHTTETSP